MAEQIGRADARAPFPPSGLSRAGAAGLVSAAKRPRTGFAAASMAHAGRRPSAPPARSPEDVVVECGRRSSPRTGLHRRCSTRMPASTRLPLIRSSGAFPKAHNIHPLTSLGRRVPAIPASQARLERPSSSAGLTLARKRNSVSADNG